MSREPDDVNKLTESTYKNVMEQFNPGLRNLVTLGKNYEKTVTAMALAGRTYFDAVSKIGENATISPVSRELGMVLMEIGETHKMVQMELEENILHNAYPIKTQELPGGFSAFKRFHREIITELEKKTEMDVKYMTATFKRYQTEHKVKQDSLERSQTDLKKLRRKSQGKNSSKYDIKENEYLETISLRQTDMQKFMADGCREALLEEKRRFCFLVDKHCMFSYHITAFHDKAKELLAGKLSGWQEKCSDATKVPDTIMTMIERPSTPLASTPGSSPLVERYNRRNAESMVPPPAPQLKAQISPLANMFHQETQPPLTSHSDQRSDQGSLGEDNLSSSASQSSDLDGGKRSHVRTIFPHKAGSNPTLLSFDEGDIILLLLQEERDGWLYGEVDATKQRGWFPSSYCRPYTEHANANSGSMDTPRRSVSQVCLPEQAEEEPVLLPPPDYSDLAPSRPMVGSTPSPHSTVSNGIGKSPAFLGGGNPFATIKLRPTVTNDRSAPHV